ncbi:hypothetical protein Tco_1048460 [Tanacetum coccineum]
MVVARPKLAKEAWGLISDIVKDNKRSRTNALKAKLRSIKLGDQTMESYFQKIESIVTILTRLDSHVNDEDVVHYALEVLSAFIKSTASYMQKKIRIIDIKEHACKNSGTLHLHKFTGMMLFSITSYSSSMERKL